jgi:hypothetical protein
VTARLIRDIALTVQQRSSALLAAACIGLLDCVGDFDIALEISQTANFRSSNISMHENQEKEELVIAYAGGTISQYLQWLETCQQWIDKLVEDGAVSNASKSVVLRGALNGGIIGAGVLAGMMDDIA